MLRKETGLSCQRLHNFHLKKKIFGWNTPGDLTTTIVWKVDSNRFWVSLGQLMVVSQAIWMKQTAWKPGIFEFMCATIHNFIPFPIQSPFLHLKPSPSPQISPDLNSVLWEYIFLHILNQFRSFPAIFFFALLRRSEENWEFFSPISVSLLLQRILRKGTHTSGNECLASPGWFFPGMFFQWGKCIKCVVILSNWCQRDIIPVRTQFCVFACFKSFTVKSFLAKKLPNQDPPPNISQK